MSQLRCFSVPVFKNSSLKTVEALAALERLGLATELLWLEDGWSSARLCQCWALCPEKCSLF